MPSNAVVTACEACWERWKSDCSGFVKAVAGHLGITDISGNANAIVDAMTVAPWTHYADAAAAVAAASEGAFVVAGRKGKPHGHLVVIVPGPAEPWPVGYWGRLNGVGQKKATINYAWKHAALPDVRYFGRRMPQADAGAIIA